ncbi:MAG TPA: acetyl-CoA hydrolase/transferase C-terminal domain-containing protein [Rhizomicrobium sp.]|jgi:acyl-CoA hydrolase|nr:acetyl-CoA hydrolase/transferase C-terminal domain-containing protein [Rhizomicrobium sp.]
MTRTQQTPDGIAEDILRAVGPRIVLALPLGLGKANHIANALYGRAVADPSIHLTIFTALTLEKPHYGNDLERRFLAPVIDRLFGAYPDLAYAKGLRDGTLPRNVEVNEFFFLAGRWLNNPVAQRNYISANYTHAIRYVLERGVNVVAQLVAKRGDRVSLSCNTDLTLELLRARREGSAKFVLAGEVNSELPFMPGEGDRPAEDFQYLLDSPATDFPLFAPPKEPIDLAEYAAGLNVARLVPDGGTLQIGIGQEGDAATHALILRQRNNAAFREAVARLSPAPSPLWHEAPFAKGLYACTEMFVDSFLSLIDAGILKREVDGAILHAAFFLGPKEFYRRLSEMPAADLAKLQMTAVSFTNALYGDEAGKRAARAGARFVNSAMMATLMGAVVSDGLEDGRVVSGVGGQYNFVEQAFALPDARSVITLGATRTSGGKTSSNIRWAYGHETIPRHLRDIVVTEYGVADLRGRSDEQVIASMLAIADSRFQPELLAAAKGAGKVARDYEIPAAHRDNTPDRIARALAPMKDLLPAFPFGTDFTAVEQRLLPALETLQSSQPLALVRLALKGLFAREDAAAQECLQRMGLETPATMRDRLYKALLTAALGA